MSWARDEVLFRAQFGLFGLRAVHNLVFREQAGRSPEAVQQVTFDLVRSLVDDGLADIGDRTEQGFVAWTLPVGDGLERVRAEYAAHVADQKVGGFDTPWLRLTEAGRRAAQAVPVDGGGESPDRSVRQWDWPFRDAAREVLLYGTIDWIELAQIHWRVKEVSPGEPAAVLQRRTLELIADLVRGGLAEVGAFGSESFGFVPWGGSLEATLSRIRSVYVDEYDDANAWEWYCMLELTRKGQLLARAIEAQTLP
jgi:hypothetical protein